MGSVLVAVALATATLAIGPSRSLAVDYRLEILTGSFTTRVGERVILTIAQPSTPEIETMLTDPTTTAVVQVSEPLPDRDSVAQVVAGGPFTVQDELVLGGPVFRASQLNEQPVYQLNIPTSGAQRSQALRIDRDGVRALRIRLSSATGLVAESTTFLNVVSNRRYNTLPVYFVVNVDSAPSVQPNGSVAVGDSERKRLRDLRDLLYRKPPNVAIGIRLRPELVDGLTRSPNSEDQGILEELLVKLPDNDILVGTFRPADVASYAAAGLRDQFEAQLLRGEQVLDALDGPSLPVRGAWLTTDAIDAASIDFLRGFGITNVVMLGGGTARYGSETDPNRPYAMRSSTNGVVLGLADERYGRLLDEPTGTAHESAAALAAEIIAQRNNIASSAVGAAALATRQLILSSAAGTPREPLIATILLRLLRSSPQVSLERITDLAPTLEGLARIQPPEVSIIDIARILSRTNDAAAAVESVRDVVASNEGVTARWTELVDVANDTSLSEQRREEYLTAVLDQVASVREAVSLPDSSFTFGSRESNLRLTLNNESGYAVTLRLLFASPTGKLSFDPGSVDLTIPARGQREVVVGASARANGLIPVELVLASPSGTVLDTAQLRVRVNAIAGLGRGVSAAFLVLLATWWIVHARRNVRKKKTKEHPALRSKA